MSAIYDGSIIATLLKDRKPEGDFVYNDLFLNTQVPNESGVLRYTDILETIPTDAEMIHTDGANVASRILSYENQTTYACNKYIQAETIPESRIAAKLDTDIVSVSAALSRTFRIMDLKLEEKAKALIDANCIADTNTATSTRARVTSAKWTPANAVAQIIPDIIAAWEVFSESCGREPNFVWMHPSVAQVVANAFLYEQPLNDFKATIQASTSAQFYDKIFGAKAKSASANYKSASATYSKFWDKNFYMGYVAGLPNYETQTKCLGQTFTWLKNDSEWDTNIVEKEDKSVKVLAWTSKDMKVIDADCIYKIAGPAGTYDLV